MINEATNKTEDDYEEAGPQILITPMEQWEGHPDPEQQDAWEKAWIEQGHTIPHPNQLRPGSRLHTEALRVRKLWEDKEREENTDEATR